MEKKREQKSNCVHQQPERQYLTVLNQRHTTVGKSNPQALFRVAFNKNGDMFLALIGTTIASLARLKTNLT